VQVNHEQNVIPSKLQVPEYPSIQFISVLIPVHKSVCTPHRRPQRSEQWRQTDRGCHELSHSFSVIHSSFRLPWFICSH